MSTSICSKTASLYNLIDRRTSILSQLPTEIKQIAAVMLFALCTMIALYLVEWFLTRPKRVCRFWQWQSRIAASFGHTFQAERRTCSMRNRPGGASYVASYVLDERGRSVYRVYSNSEPPESLTMYYLFFRRMAFSEYDFSRPPFRQVLILLPIFAASSIISVFLGV